MSSSDAVNVDQAGDPVSEPKSEVIDQTAEVNQAPVVQEVPNQAPPVVSDQAAAATEQAPPVVVSESTAAPAATEQAPAAPVVSVPEEAITAMYETIIAIAKWFNNVDPKEVFNALTAKGVPDFEELKKAFTTQILVNVEKQRIALLLLKTDGSDLGKTTFDEFLKLAPTPAPAPVAAHDETAVAAAVSEQSASSAPAPAPVAATPANVSDAAAVTPAPAVSAESEQSASPAPVANVSDATPVAANVSDATPVAATPADEIKAGGGSKKKRSQTKRKNGHRHHISRNRKARA